MTEIPVRACCGSPINCEHHGACTVPTDRIHDLTEFDINRALKTIAVTTEVVKERRQQDKKWGEQNHPDIFKDEESLREHYQAKAEQWKRTNAARVRSRNEGGFPSDRNAAWDGILFEEVYEALAESDPAKLRAELVQAGAVVVAWIEAIDRRAA